MINVKLTPSGLTAYLSVWMGRRCAGLVGFRWVAWCFAWIAGANLRCRLLSLSFRLWLGVNCLWIYVLIYVEEFYPFVGFWRFHLWIDVVLWHVNFGDVWIVSAATVENFYMHVCWILLRRSVYFLNICYIRVFYRFNRNRAL
jgi:hypothetical protein